MTIAILFRKREAPNLFREFILNSIALQVGDNALMCSGFFQEARGNNYRASSEGGLASILSNTKTKLTTIGIHNNSWTPSYRDFIASLNSAGVNVDAFISSRLKWHAKIFLLRKGKIPKIGIIGSSNITRPAFGITDPFNYEADVVLWSGAKKRFQTLLKKSFPESDDWHQLIVAPYSPDSNGGLTIEQRLSLLYDEVTGVQLKKLSDIG